MKIPWSSIANLGAKLVTAVANGSATVEMLGGRLATPTGAAKQNAVLALVQEQVSAAFTTFDPLLLFNPRVVAAIRAVIDSIVALQQIIAEELNRRGTLPTLPAGPTSAP
jgi:hypothetical protein